MRQAATKAPMAFLSVKHPDLLVIHFRWANRLSDWRARPGEAAFQMLALLAFVAFGLWVIDPIWARMLDPTAAWARWLPAIALATALAVGQIVQAERGRQKLATRHVDDWLAAMPIAAAARAEARQHIVAARSIAQAVLALALLLWAATRSGSLRTPLLTALALGVSAGAVIGALKRASNAAVRAPVSAAHARVATVVAIPATTRGLALLGAALEPALARLPKSAPWVAGSFLLFPPSTPVIAVPALVVLFTALSCALDLVVHWRQRYLEDQSWLAAQPLTPLRLFGAYLPYLVRRTLLWSLVLGACSHALGAPALFAAALAVVLMAVVADAVLCGFATRTQPQRYALLLAVHGVILLTTTQVLPPALPLIYAGCAFSAWRRGLA